MFSLVLLVKLIYMYCFRIDNTYLGVILTHSATDGNLL